MKAKQTIQEILKALKALMIGSFNIFILIPLKFILALLVGIMVILIAFPLALITMLPLCIISEIMKVGGYDKFDKWLISYIRR